MSDVGDMPEFATPADPLRPAFEALSAAGDPLAKLKALARAATDLATPIRHGLLDLYETEERLINLANSHSLITEFTLGTVEEAVANGLRTPALREEPERGNGHAAAIEDGPPPPRGADEYGLRIEEAGAAGQLTGPVEFRSAASWPDGAPAPVRWVVRDKIPRGDVSTLDGDGGLGKTMAATQLAAALARGDSAWLGCEVGEQGVVVFLSVEEPEPEMHRRTYRIAARGRFNLSELANLHFWFPPNVGDCLLAAQTRAGTIEPTPLFRSIAARIIEMRPALVVVDNIAAVYGGDQNHRGMVRVFINLWRGLAHSSGAAILLLNHPSLSGLTAGTGRGGSMDWRNAVRAALHLKTAPDQADADRGVRILECVKNNYAPLGPPLRLEWIDGVLTVEGTASPHQRAAQDAQGDEKFLALLALHMRLGIDVGPSPGQNYAPKLFAEHAENGGYRRQAFAAIMQRLQLAGRVTVEEYGPQSRRRKRLVIAGQGGPV